MSDFSAVDTSNNVDRLVAYLDATDAGLAAMKSYMAAAARRATAHDAVVLDVGCGVGHDLVRLESLGLQAIGIDASVGMLRVAGGRLQARSRLAHADGAFLPIRSGSLDGCRVERLLQHVEAPIAVVVELARVLRPGGFLAVFEPDYRTFLVDSDVHAGDRAAGSLPARALRVRHPAIGGQLVELLESAGFRVDDVVVESSRGYHVERLPVNAGAVLARAVADGRLEAATAEAWMGEQRARSEVGTFRASWDKILVVAHWCAPERPASSERAARGEHQ